MLSKEHQTLLQAAPQPQIVVDTDAPNFSVTWLNPAALLLANLPSDQLLEGSVFDLFCSITGSAHCLDNGEIRSAFQHSLDHKRAQQIDVHRYTKSYSDAGRLESSVWHVIIYPVCDAQGDIMFLVVNLQPDASQHVASRILESITDGFYAVDRDWTVTYWNKEAERILQRSRESIIGMNLWKAYPIEEHEALYTVYQKVLKEKVSTHIELFYTPLDKWMEISIFPSERGLSVYFKDVNDRKVSDEKLKEAKKQYEDLFDLSPLPQWVYDLKTFIIIDINRAAIQHYGYSKEEFLKMSIRDLKPPEEVPILEEVVKIAVSSGSFPKTAGRHITKSGALINVQVEGNSIMFEGRPCMLVLAVDVTERTKARQDLQASEKKFRALVQDGSDLQTILTPDGYFTYVNLTTTRILEMPEDRIVGKFGFDFVHAEDRARVMNDFFTLNVKTTHSIAPYRFINGQGTYVWLETIITNMTDDPAVRGIVANSRDVTSRMAIAQQMEKNIDRFNIVSKATSDAIWDLDVLTGIVVWNDVAKTVFGFKETSHDAGWWRNHVHPDDLPWVTATIDQVVKHKGTRVELEYRFRCEDGGYKHILDRSFMLYDSQGQLKRVIGSMQDMTDRVKYLQHVEAQNEHLKNIAWTQSHVVRAPLSRILGIADLLQYSLSPDDPNAELIQHLSSSATELDNVIRDLVKKTEAIYKQEDNS